MNHKGKQTQSEVGPSAARPGSKRPGRRRLVAAAGEGVEARLSERQRQLLEERMLKEISRAAKHCLAVEEAFKTHPAPLLETLLSLHRVMTLKVSAQAGQSPILLKLVNSMMKPLLEWAALEEKRRARELKEAALRQENAQARGGKGLTQQTRGNIEDQLGLLQAGQEPELPKAP